MKTKAELRKEILQLRDALALEERCQKSHQIATQVIAQRAFQEADKVLLFASYRSEVDTTEIFQAARKLSKDIYYPKVVGDEMEFYLVLSEDDLKEGYRGIREPEADEERRFVARPEDKVCVIMPGAVFDEVGNRIGYGGGYYDKFLQKQKLSVANISKIAVAFQCQLVETGVIYIEEHDIKMDCTITEKTIFNNLSTIVNTKKNLMQ